MLKNSNELTEKAAKENNLDKTQAFRQSAESKSDNIGQETRAFVRSGNLPPQNKTPEFEKSVDNMNFFKFRGFILRLSLIHI